MLYGHDYLYEADIPPLVRDRTRARMNMLELENAEYHILHNLHRKTDIDGFLASPAGNVIRRNEEQLKRYRNQYNDDTLPLWLEREYSYTPSQTPWKNPHLAEHDNKRSIASKYTSAKRASASGNNTKLDQFANDYPEVFDWYEHYRNSEYYPAPRAPQVYDFRNIQQSPHSIDATQDKIRNPHTGRLVSVTGALGKRIMQRLIHGTGSGY